MARPSLSARPPATPAEERRLRKLAAAQHAPASRIQRARIITASWDGASVAELAERLGCHPKTASRWPHRFNQTPGVDGWPTCPARACPDASASTSAAGSSPWPARSRPAACSRAARGCWPPTSPRRRRAGPGHAHRGCPGQGHPGGS